MSNSIKVMFLCTGNCCRSQMAEALLRHLAPDAFESFSAGSRPAGYIHPLALAAMEQMGVSTEGQRSKSWEEFVNVDLDLVVTVCNHAAKEVCPIWPDAPMTVHWPVMDPSGVDDGEAERLRCAVMVAKRLKMKIEEMIAMDFAALPREELQSRLDALAEY